MRRFLFSSSVILLSVVMGMIAFPNLNQEVAIHWNVAEADLFVSKFFAVWTMPVLMVLSLIVMRVTPKLQGNVNTQKTIAQIHNIALVLMLSIHLLILALGLNLNVNENFFKGIFIGVVMIVLANPMQKTRPNALFGVRTPWTLKDERVWRKSNKFGGLLCMVCGFVILLLAFMIPQHIAIVSVIILLAVVCIAVLHSYVAFRRLININ